MAMAAMRRSGHGPLILALITAVVLLTGCANGYRPQGGGTVPRDQRDLVGTWFDAQGQALPDGTNASNGILVLQAGTGSTTCSDEGENMTVFIEMAWPPGRRLDWSRGYGEGDAQRYVRDTEGSLLAADGVSDLDTTLPREAADTGITKDGNALYAISSDPSSIWIRRPDGRIEQWASLRDGEGCA